MQDQWIREGKGFLLVYSITHDDTFFQIEELRDKILRTKDVDSGDNIPIVIAGNKCDLENERKVSYQEGEKLAKEWNCPFFETSAKTKINNVECFYKIVQLIRELPAKNANAKVDKPRKRVGCQIL